jgi:hypothetical protein
MFVAENGAGYAQLSLTADSRAAISYHRAPVGAESLFCSIDLSPGLGQFDRFQVPNQWGSIRFVWPYIATDRNGRIHSVATHNNPAVGRPQPLMYVHSSDNGQTWANIQLVDTILTLSATVASSRVSDKVAIVYTHPTDTAYQNKNDVYYVLSNDGVTWDWPDGKINITNYGQGGDSLFALTDCDAVFDFNDRLHIVWNAQFVDGTGGVCYPTYLFHFENNSGTITAVLIGYNDWPENGCDFGTWNRQICKMSLGVHQTTNTLYTVYTRFDSADCSVHGFANGDLFMQFSQDGGELWSTPLNLTNSHSPNCSTGACNSDHWSSLAEVVDDNLHIFYVNDKDPGRVSGQEGGLTDNPMLYLAYQNPIVGIGEEAPIPKSAALLSNYPNPFNGQTLIEFEVPFKSNVQLAIYDITGKQACVLYHGEVEAGHHKMNWLAQGLASGLYFARLQYGSSHRTAKMVLLK